MVDLKGSIGVIFIGVGIAAGICYALNIQPDALCGIVFAIIGILFILYEKLIGHNIFSRFHTINETNHIYKDEMIGNVNRAELIQLMIDTDAIPGWKPSWSKKRNGIVTEEVITEITKVLDLHFKPMQSEVLLALFVVGVEALATTNNYGLRLQLIYLERELRNRGLMLNNKMYEDVVQIMTKTKEEIENNNLENVSGFENITNDDGDEETIE